jgi:hypothetical protein
MDHEDDLITSRLNWLITSQSFLFAAYATLFRSGGAQQVVRAEVPPLVRLIPMIGMLSGILIYTAIIAGVVALMHNRNLLRTHLAQSCPVTPTSRKCKGVFQWLGWP